MTKQVLLPACHSVPGSWAPPQQHLVRLTSNFIALPESINAVGRHLSLLHDRAVLMSLTKTDSQDLHLTAFAHVSLFEGSTQLQRICSLSQL